LAALTMNEDSRNAHKTAATAPKTVEGELKLIFRPKFSPKHQTSNN
jgi:hypothetical protein